MANTTPVYARVDTDLKETAEKVLAQLGITPSSAIHMFYSQIVLRQGLPFELTILNEESKKEREKELTQNVIDSKLGLLKVKSDAPEEEKETVKENPFRPRFIRK